METGSRANNTNIPVIVEKTEVEKEMYEDYDALQVSLDNLRRQEEEINKLINLNTKELQTYRSLYFENKKNFNKCKDKKCCIRLITANRKRTEGIRNSYVSQCEQCKSFYLMELVPDCWGENYTYQYV